MNKNIIFYGKANPLPRKHFLRAGSLDVVYENACLRYISMYGIELIRNIYAAVRDRNWGTVLPQIIEENIRIKENSFEIAYTAHYKNKEIDFEASYRIIGQENNAISLEMKGKALNTFKKNRIGFCVLHPLQGFKGKECKITNAQGEIVIAHFPIEISAKSPMTNIKMMEWEDYLGTYQLFFEGDIWEMEDHRNWTDSSFKTFCTPLDLPYPIEIEQGTEVWQKITFLFTSKEQAKIQKNETEYSLSINRNEPKSFPQIGLAESSILRKLTENEVNILKQANFHHLRFDLKLSAEKWQEQLAIAVYNAQALHTQLELAIHFTPNFEAEIKAVENSFLSIKDLVSIVWIVDEKTRVSTTHLIAYIIKYLRAIFPKAIIGGGADAYFAEFNRNVFDATSLDFVTFAVCPQVHAFDNDSLIENIASQFDVLETCAKLYPHKQLSISPITLRQRFNVVATGEEHEPPANQLPDNVDERQMSLFAAGWTLGSLGAIIQGNCNMATYYETIGWRGVIQGDETPPVPTLFASQAGYIFPVYHLFSFLNQLQPTFAYIVKTSYPMKFSALEIGKDKESYLIIANHTNEVITLTMTEYSYCSYKKIDADNIELSYKDYLFLKKLEWKNIENQVIVLSPYSLFFLKSN
jgi:hypothetical protein